MSKKGKVTAVIGCQFGDEGKGKIVDFLAQDADVVARFNGGDNAGHTVENPHGDFKLRIVPVGTLSPRTELNVIGRGVVWSIGGVAQELKMLEGRSMDVSSLRIDVASHLVMPWHRLEDVIEEELRGEESIGTTGNGIGPAYADKYRRAGFRAGDLLDFSRFKKRFWQVWAQRMELFTDHYGHFKKCSGCDACKPMLDERGMWYDIEHRLNYLADRFGGLRNLIVDTPPLLWNTIDEGKNVLLEGAQGALLDIDYGTYPYVTSSMTGVNAAAQGSGIAPSEITEVIGVVKAYMSRVGSGPFPTRAVPYYEDKLRELGNEYGTVTGRPRKCGWFDIPSFKRVARLNGLTAVAITRLDILDDFSNIEKIQVHTGMRGKRTVDVFLDGWGPEESVKTCRTWRSLPKKAKEYCEFIACGVPIKIVSVGSRREETIAV